MDCQLYETPTDRQTTYHTVTLQLDPRRERTDRTADLLAYLERRGERADTARNIAPKFHLTVEETTAILERAAANGLLKATNVGALRLYRRITRHPQAA